MWVVFASFGFPLNFVTFVRTLYDGVVGRVCHQTLFSSPFHINDGLKQGCVLVPICFLLYTEFILNEIPPDTQNRLTLPHGRSSF